MKPLTIEQLKALKVGEWIWIVKIGDGRLKSDYAGYFEIINLSDTGILRSFHRILRDVCFNIADYGKTWLAYKNKEQEELEEYKIFHKNGIWEVKKLRTNYGVFRMFPAQEEAERCLAELKGEKR